MGNMTFTVSPWLVWAGVCLALFGVWFLGRAAWQAGRDAAGWLAGWWRWWWHDRVAPLLEEETCPECGAAGVHEWDCPVDPALDPLPPERTWEQMTNHQLPVDLATHYPDGRRRGFTYGAGTGREDRPLPGEPQYLAPERERRAPKWEAEARGHYMSMGLEFPSGLMARVRELAP